MAHVVSPVNSSGYPLPQLQVPGFGLWPHSSISHSVLTHDLPSTPQPKAMHLVTSRPLSRWLVTLGGLLILKALMKTER